jgi:hypothetical protein
VVFQAAYLGVRVLHLQEVSVYLEAYLAADQSSDQTQTSGNGTTKKHLSTIEVTLITGTFISALSLAINIWNSTRKRTAE